MNINEKELYSAKKELVDIYLNHGEGIYGVGVGREDGDFCIRISGEAGALNRLPKKWRGIRVVGRPAGPDLICAGSYDEES